MGGDRDGDKKEPNGFWLAFLPSWLTVVDQRMQYENILPCDQTIYKNNTKIPAQFSLVKN